MSHSEPYRLVIIFAVGILLLLKEAHFVAGLTDEQLQEVKRLRLELEDAFDKHDNAMLAESGVIVQPGWTQSADSTSQENAKVVVTSEGLDEVKRLRDEIAKAVQGDVYVASVANSAAGDSQQVKQLEKSFELKDRSKEALESLLTSELNSTAANAKKHADNVGAALDDFDDDTDIDGPNTVESSAAMEPDLDIRKLQRLEVAKRRTKELLVLKYIEEDLNFNLGEDVFEWEHILHNGKEYFVGRREQDLIIVLEDALKYEKGNVLAVGHPISYLETYGYWNVEQQQQEGVILVASRDYVLWYRGNNETHQIELYWEWSTGRTISGLTHFKVEHNDYLAVSSNESSRSGFYALNIYQFDLHAQEFWIAQRLQLQHSCGEVTILDTGRDIVLAVAQLNTAAIYTFNPRADSNDHIRFQLLSSIESEGIEFISGFTMGGRSYLTVGGMQPQILLYQQGEFVPKTIFGQNFGLVELFFPIPVRTYRDDLVLLVQHRVDFGTHGLTVLETLIWNGESFEASIPVPCQLGSHEVYGVSCMLDIQRDDGLKGAALLMRGDEISIIVPRHKAESGLFRLHTELLARNSELLDLQEIFKFLQDWVKEQDELIAQAQAYLDDQHSENSRQMPDLTELELLKTPELIFNGDIGEIYINDYIWSQEDTDVDLDFVMKSIEDLGQTLLSGRHRRDLATTELTFDSLEFDEVEVDELLLELLNGEQFYIEDGALNFDGILNMHSLKVLERMQARDSGANQTESLEIIGNLELQEINGIAWGEIKEGLVFRNEPITLKELTVNGEIVIEDELKIEHLNALKFPEDYLWSSGPTSSVVRAEKTFLGTLAANAVDTDGGLINGANPFDAITLSEAQDWDGLTTFASLEVSEKLELLGAAHGRGLEDFEANPKLQESHFINAACNFAHLEVLGAIQLNGKFENNDMALILADIVQRSANAEQVISIASSKNFSTINFPIDFHLSESTINNIAIEEFVTVHTEQQLNITALQAYVYFNNLTIAGSYDGVNIAELLENAIRIDEPQTTVGTQLNMVNSLTADEFKALSSLNGVPIAEGYQTLFEDLITKELKIDSLQAKIGTFSENILGNATLNGLNLREFLAHRTWSEPANTGNVFLQELTLQDGLYSDAFHGINASFLLTFLNKIDEIPEMILDGKIQVDHIVVTGDVQVYKLNGHNFDEDIQLTAIWLNRQNYLSTALKFVEPLVLKADVYVEGALNGNNLGDLIDDMVFRTYNGTMRITAPKRFMNNVLVKRNTIVDAINGLSFQQIATKHGLQEFKGTLHLNGKLVVKELSISGYLNDYPLSSLSSLVRYDQQLSAFVLRGEIPILAPMQLQDLSVQGNLNNYANMSAFFAQLVYRANLCILRGKYSFTGRVSIEKGAYIRSLNGYNLLALMSQMVFVRATEPIIIKSPINFRTTVKARDVTVKESLMATNLNGCSLQAWLEDSLRVDRDEEIRKPLKFNAGALDGNAFYASYLNDIDLSQVITLHTAQNLSRNLVFSEIYLDGALISLGLVNDVNLLEEYENTLLTHGDQHIATPLTMQSCRVLKSLQTNAPVNGAKNLRQLATLNESLEFRSPLFLHSISARNIYTKDLVSGINLDQWHQNALWLQERPQQWITGNWSTRLLTVKSPIAQEYSRELMRSAREDKSFYEVCQRVAKLLQKRRKRVCYVKYLEEATELKLKIAEDAKIRYVFPLNFNESHYIILNQGCQSIIHKWNQSTGAFGMLTSFDSGLIDQLMLVPNIKNSTLPTFITNTESKQHLNCTLTGLNSWVLHENMAKHLRSFSQNFAVLHQSKALPNNFYALDMHRHSVHEYSWLNESHTNTWYLPTVANKSAGTYRFLPQPEIYLSNGQHILQLNVTAASKRLKRSSPYRFSLPFISSGSLRQIQQPSESILKPNATTRKLSFADFQQVVERILNDLVYRLNLEVNITQLSIPESDLYDEHLVEDFLAIMLELQKQKIFPVETFADIDLETLQVPANPAQVLAARTVQIIWPVITEIEEVHSYLRENETHTHPVCACITSNLGTTIKDVLNLAYSDEKTKDYMPVLMAIIERIRKFQAILEELIKELKENIQEERKMNETDLIPMTAPAQPISNFSNSEIVSASFRPHPDFNGSLLYTESSHMPSCLEGEVISFDVGSTNAPRSLTAVTSSKPHLVAGQHDGIKLYTNALKGQLFQTVGAHKPRALTALRIRDETLLVFVEDCCLVRVLIYRGVQGFVELVQFSTTEEVQNLIELSLPSSEWEQRYFIAINVGKRVLFYEVILAGDKGMETQIQCK